MDNPGVSAAGPVFYGVERLKAGAQAWHRGDVTVPVVRDMLGSALMLVATLASMEPSQTLPIDVHRRLLLDLYDPALDLGAPAAPPHNGDFGPADVEELARPLQSVVDVARDLFALRAGVHSPTSSLFGVPQYQPLLEVYERILSKLDELRSMIGPETEDGHGLALMLAQVRSEALVVHAVARMTIAGDLDRGLLRKAVTVLDDKIDELAGYPPSVGLLGIRFALQKRKWAVQSHGLMLRRMSSYPPPLGDPQEWIDIHVQQERLAEETHAAITQQGEALVADITGFATEVLGSEAAAHQAVAGPGVDVKTELQAQRVFSECRLLTARVGTLEARLLAAVVAQEEADVGELSDEIARRYVRLMASSSALDNLIQRQNASGGQSREDQAGTDAAATGLFSTAVAHMEDRSARARKAARQAVHSGKGLADVIAGLADRRAVSLFIGTEVFMGSKYEFNAPVTGAVGDHAVYFQGALSGIDRARLAAELAAVRAELPREEIGEDDEAALESAETAARSGDEKTLVVALKALGAKVWDLVTQVGTGVALAAAKQQLGL